MKKMFLRKLSIITYGCIFVAVHGCGPSSPESGQGQGPAPAQTRPGVLVHTQEVNLRTMHEVLEFPGTLEPENMANVLSTMEGKITQMELRQGDKVTEGQVLAMLSPLLREDIINSARLNMQHQEQAFDLDPGNESIRILLEQARSDYAFAISQYREIPVIAPVSGVISDRWVDLGDMVAARHKMFEIQSNHRFLVNVPVSELDIRKLTLGQEVRIFSDACPGRNFYGSIQRIYPQVDRLSRNATVEVLFPSPCPELRSGMYVRTAFTTRTVRDAIAIPVQALVIRGNDRFAFVVEEGQAKEISVETGLQADGLVEIVSGLQAGQQLVIEGQEQLRPGVPVRVQQTSTADQNSGGNE
jgi:membrane fusion protein, multidrug efflux system